MKKCNLLCIFLLVTALNPFNNNHWRHVLPPLLPRRMSTRWQTVCRHVGESRPLALKAPVSAFCTASVDVFPVKAPLLGELTHIRLSHNARGANPDWLVEMVRIVHVESHQEWLFFGHVWLHSSNGNQVHLTRGRLLTEFASMGGRSVQMTLEELVCS